MLLLSVAYLKKHLIPAVEILAFIVLIWLVKQFPFVFFIYLIVGFVIGSLVLELDHFIYWYFLDPKNQESIIAKNLIKQKKYKKIIKLIGDTAQFHTSLIFHHFIFQTILLIITFFVFTSTSSVLAKSIVFFTNTNLVIKQIYQLSSDKAHLQKWLFARLEKQISLQKIHYYVYLVTIIDLVFLVKLITL